MVVLCSSRSSSYSRGRTLKPELQQPQRAQNRTRKSTMATERDDTTDNDEREKEEDKPKPSSRNDRKSKRHAEESDDSDASSRGSDEDRRKHRSKRKRRSSSRKKRYSDDSGSGSESGSDSESEDYSGSEYSDSGSECRSDSEEERRRRKRRGRRKREEKERERRKREKRRKRDKEDDRRKRKKKEKMEKDKKKKKKDKEKGKVGAVTSSWGKYGIVREIDMWNKRPEFTAWLAEVKKVNLESLPNWEEKKMFKEYMEDYNTATFTSKKYYDLDAYHRRKMEKQMKSFKKVVDTERVVFNDEEQRRLEMMQVREKQKEQEVEALKQAMKGGMAQAMKEQARLKEEMQYLYKIGNFEAAAAIQKKLDPDVAM